jgi:Lrp/AsnC family leucine-responsive transcriptional regulator
MKKRLISRGKTLALDETDLAILEILQENARTSNAEIARRLGLAPSAILERIRKLEARNVVEGYPARLRARALGLDLTAFAFVRSEEGRDAVDVAASLATLPEIQEVHHVAGEDCLLVKLRAADTGSLGEFLRTRVGAIKGVRATRTTIVLETVKETSRLAIQAKAPETPSPRRRPGRRRKLVRRPQAAE